MSKTWTIEQEKYLIDNYKNYIYDDIALALNKSCNSIHHKAIKLKLYKGNRIYSLDEDYFNTIDNQEKAYWYGFLWADGCVQERKQKNHIWHILTIALAIKDIEILQKFADCIKTDKPIFHDDKKCIIDICSDKIFIALNKLNIVPRKTYKDLIPNISENFTKHFIRGILDGDGYISANPRCRLEIAGNKAACEWINNVIYNNTQELGHIYPTHSKYCYRYVIENRLKTLKILDWLYSDALIYLERKYTRYKNLKFYLENSYKNGRPIIQRKCLIEGCTKPFSAKNYCIKHYYTYISKIKAENYATTN